MMTDPNPRDTDPEPLREEDVRRADLLDDRVDESEDFPESDDD